MQRIVFVIGLVLLSTAIFSTVAVAQSECDQALVKATYGNFGSDHVDQRLASEVDENTWKEITHNGSANATIFGIGSGGGTYADFQNNIAARKNSFSQSLTHDQARNIMWTGLDPSSETVYSDCLNALVLINRGLHIVVKFATTSDITLNIVWKPEGIDPPTVNTIWTPPITQIDRTSLPTQVRQGANFVVIARPAAQQALVVNAAEGSAAIVLEPLPGILPPLPHPEYDRDYIYGIWCDGTYNVTYTQGRFHPSERPREGDPDELNIQVARVATGEVTENETYNYFFSKSDEFRLTKHRPNGVELNVHEIVDANTFQPYITVGPRAPFKRGRC
jgi:hypothetical protein